MATAQKKLDPLREFLDAVVTRIEALESHCGLSSGVSSGGGSGGLSKTPSVRHISGAGESPGLKAFDKFLSSAVYKFADTCDDLGDMDNLGKLVVETFEGMRYVIVLASRAKQPTDMKDLQPHLTPITDAVTKIRALRLKRDYDNHMKAVMEMLACVSWVTCRAPSQLPAPFVKECIGSADFWSNRIRKEFKGKDAPNQIAFCDNSKKVLIELAAYIEEHHKTGVTFNPKGVSIAEAAIVLSDTPASAAAAEAAASVVGNVVKGGNVMGLMSELAGRRTGDGASAATGLKKVSKDQQTWRKEFKDEKPKPKVVVQAPAPAPKKAEKKKKRGLPILEYQERGTKWVIENHTTETATSHSGSSMLEVDVTDPKQQVYIYNCDGVTVKINGDKCKSVIIDTCEKVNVIFQSIISGCETVNSKKLAIQADGVCPVFTIDKTVGITLWLSQASVEITSFTTSMSSEMNVSIPDGDDRKEMPIPEQFVHKIEKGSLSSEVSDLYH
eukprot:CAMPEP_0117070462 /NCGR_PEP_ID=MMETSP0472-20121206/49504_1 /TAXON_ID=693140 ORGANISM="Tiarina fusus, Strain LIS" /NCGR_SAMPLE_ID=MMETSP0472 /ASSEMBLY_ACC=CAM_ASM_000603 /LENGTH=498 /DNA_ID=CAMNT_0004793579 /DNA_START=27 /DNA_END=1523 /DNA_ORIENTATION=+